METSNFIKIIFFLSIIQNYYGFSQSQMTGSQNKIFDCISPTGLKGYCIKIIECPALVRLILTVPLYQKDINYLKDAKCGVYDNNQPKVCCVPDNFD